jgi:hypothetical protein
VNIGFPVGLDAKSVALIIQLFAEIIGSVVSRYKQMNFYSQNIQHPLILRSLAAIVLVLERGNLDKVAM